MKQEKEETVSHRISLYTYDVDFIKQYKEAGRTKSLQDFVREAVREKIKQIGFMENIELLSKVNK